MPGVLIHALFSPLVANAVLHLAVQSTATLSMFSILRVTTGLRGAFLGTMVFAVFASTYRNQDGLVVAIEEFSRVFREV